jgi:hypothetical protein
MHGAGFTLETQESDVEPAERMAGHARPFCGQGFRWQLLELVDMTKS